MTPLRTPFRQGCQRELMLSAVSPAGVGETGAGHPAHDPTMQFEGRLDEK
jgi:hypothetical protein